MSHTYCSALFHCVFSTKERRKIIPAEMQPRLWAYIGGVARKREMTALGVGGTDDQFTYSCRCPRLCQLPKR